jgi:hypothetical protein
MNKATKQEVKKIERKLDAVKKTEKEILADQERESRRDKARAKMASERAKWGMTPVKNTKRGHNLQDEVDLYVRQLLDPFNTYSAVVPDVHSYPTTTFSVKTPLTVTTNADGRFCLFVRDGLTYHYVTNNTTAFSEGLIYNGGWELATSSIWNSGSEITAVRGAFSAYRPVAMGVRLVYDAAPVDASGRIAMGYLPGTQALPFIYNSDVNYVLPFGDYSEYMNVITGAAISGGSVVWRPMTPQNHFRPTKPKFYSGATADTYDFMAYSNPQLGVNGPATWDLDPEVASAMMGLSFYSDLGLISASPRSAAQELNHKTIPMNTPLLCIMGEGLPADTQVFAGEIVAHYEGIADNRSFSLVQSQQRVARPGSMDQAIHRVSRVHPAHSGGSLKAHTDWLGQAVKITQGIASTATTVSGIVNSVPKVVQPLLEAAETVAALF